jgi:hypothetical protein
VATRGGAAGQPLRAAPLQLLQEPGDPALMPPSPLRTVRPSVRRPMSITPLVVPGGVTAELVRAAEPTTPPPPPKTTTTATRTPPTMTPQPQEAVEAVEAVGVEAVEAEAEAEAEAEVPSTVRRAPRGLTPLHVPRGRTAEPVLVRPPRELRARPPPMPSPLGQPTPQPSPLSPLSTTLSPPVLPRTPSPLSPPLLRAASRAAVASLRAQRTPSLEGMRRAWLGGAAAAGVSDSPIVQQIQRLGSSPIIQRLGSMGAMGAMGATGSIGPSAMGPSTSSASLQPSAPPAPLSLLGLCFGLSPEQEEAFCAAFATAGQEVLPAAPSGGEVVGGGEGGALSPVVSGARTSAVSAEVEVEAEAVAVAVAEAAEEARLAAVAVKAKAVAAEAARSAAEAEAKAAEEAPPFQSNFEAACHMARVAAEAQAAAAQLEAPRYLGLPRD